MSLGPTFSPEKQRHHADCTASLVQPLANVLPDLLEARLEIEEKGCQPGPLPPGVMCDLRPSLPKIGFNSLLLFSHRKVVDSYPMLYTTLAVAHPN